MLDLKVPDSAPGWLAQLGTAMVRPFASIDEWLMRRPWEAIRAAMQEELADLSWTELFFGTAFLAAGSRARPMPMDTQAEDVTQSAVRDDNDLSTVQNNLVGICALREIRR